MKNKKTFSPFPRLAALSAAALAGTLLAASCAATSDDVARLVESNARVEDVVGAARSCRDLNAPTSRGASCLYIAVRGGKIRAAEELAALGATLSLREAQSLYKLSGNSAAAEEFLRPLFPDKMNP